MASSMFRSAVARTAVTAATATTITLIGIGASFRITGNTPNGPNIGGSGSVLQQWANSGTIVGRMHSSGSLAISGTFVSENPTSIGWSIQNAADQACNTTCTHACVFGQTLGTGSGVVACTDAGADRCVCAGPN